MRLIPLFLPILYHFFPKMSFYRYIYSFLAIKKNYKCGSTSSSSLRQKVTLHELLCLHVVMKWQEILQLLCYPQRLRWLEKRGNVKQIKLYHEGEICDMLGKDNYPDRVHKGQDVLVKEWRHLSDMTSALFL